MRPRGLVVLAILAISLTIVHCQEQSCFTNALPGGNLLAGDVHSINLDSYTIGNNIKFDYNSTAKTESMVKVDTFSPSGGESALDMSVNSCYAYARGMSEQDYAFLCDDKKILMVTFNARNGMVESKSMLDLLDDVKCHSIGSSRRRGMSYVACTNNTDLLIYPVSWNMTARPQPLVVVQSEATQILQKNIKVLADDVNFDIGLDTVIYLWEDDVSVPKTRFRLIRDKNGNLQNGGFFSSDSGYTTNLADGALVSFHYDGSRILLVTRKGGVNQVQKCFRSPVYSKYMCEKKVTEMATSDGLVKMVNLDENQHISRLIQVSFVTKDKIIIGLLDADTLEYQLSSTHDIKGHSLVSVKDVMVANGNIYLVGPTKESESNIIDGIVKFKNQSVSIEEYSYPENRASMSIIIADYFDPEFARLINVAKDTIFTYPIRKNYLIVNTASYKEDGDRMIEYTINCTSTLESVTLKGSATFTLNVLLTVNDAAQYAIPNVTAYAGSKWIYVPTNNDDIQGNSPEIALLNTTMKDVELEYVYNSPGNVSFKNAQLDNIKSVRHIGENVFSAWNDEKAVFFKCKRADKKTNFSCNSLFEDINLAEDKQTYLKAQVLNGIMVVLTTTADKYIDDINPAITRIQAFSLEDGQKVFEPVNVTFRTRLAEVKMWEGNVTIITIGSKYMNQTEGIYGIKFNMYKPNIPTAFKLIQGYKDHFCPKELAWAPRLKAQLYVSSICDNKGTDNHVYVLGINFTDPVKSEITSTYVVSGSAEFRICPQHRLINIIDFNGPKIYSFDTQTGQNTKLRLPLKEYGMDTIVRHTCDQDNNILQVLAKSKDGGSTKLITYRADLAHKPSNRVHSVVEDGSPAGKSFTHLASSFNDENDDTITLLTGDSLSTIGINLIEADGPHIRIQAPKAIEGNFTVDWTINYPGPKQQLINVTQYIALVKQQSDIKVSLINETIKAPGIGSVELDKYLAISGPYHSLGSKHADGVLMLDRISPSQLFDTVKTVLDDAAFLKDYIFGYKKTGLASDLILLKNEVIVQRIEDVAVTSIFAIEKSNGEMYFFAYGRKQLDDDQIVCIYTKDSGASWKIAKYTLKQQGYKTVYIIDGPDNKFIFGGSNNLQQYRATAMILEVNNDRITTKSSWTYTFTDNIADFDITWIGGEDVIIIVGVQYRREADFFWLKITDGSSLMAFGQTRNALVPNVQETHQDVVFKCLSKPDDRSNLYCAHSGQNLHSYLVRYKLNLNTPETKNFIEGSFVETKLRNIVNLKPIRVDFHNEFISFMVENKMPLTEGQAPQYNSFFSESHLCLIYKTDSFVHQFDDPDVPIVERDVYKILTPTDLGVTKKEYLNKLDPKLFIDKTGKAKLGVNVGSEQRSVKVFNLDGLTMIIDQSKIANDQDFELKFRGLNQSESIFKASTFVNREKKEDGKPEPKPDDDKKPIDPTPAPKAKSNTIFILIIICAVALTLAIIAIGVIMTKKNKENAEEMNIDEVERTMKIGNEDSVSGNYSKL